MCRYVCSTCGGCEQYSTLQCTNGECCAHSPLCYDSNPTACSCTRSIKNHINEINYEIIKYPVDEDLSKSITPIVMI